MHHMFLMLNPSKGTTPSAMSIYSLRQDRIRRTFSMIENHVFYKMRKTRSSYWIIPKSTLNICSYCCRCCRELCNRYKSYAVCKYFSCVFHTLPTMPLLLNQYPCICGDSWGACCRLRRDLFPGVGAHLVQTGGIKVQIYSLGKGVGGAIEVFCTQGSGIDKDSS